VAVEGLQMRTQIIEVEKSVNLPKQVIRWNHLFE
jgi:hypothetical protein